MLVLRRESATSLLVINPHVQNVRKGRNTVYGTNCVVENLRRGDTAHFFAFPPNGTDVPPPLSESCAVLTAPTQVTDPAVLADAKVLAAAIQKNFSTVAFDASDIWRVVFTVAVPVAVDRAAIVNLDSFSTPGTIVRNNSFTHTRYNLGRFKSNGGAIINNTLTVAGVPNLEITPLLQYFEGNLPFVRDVVVSGNTIIGEGDHPIHCSPFCSKACPYGECAKCPSCDHDSPWAVNISVVGNRIIPSPP
jgi:hypothetical protein